MHIRREVVVALMLLAPMLAMAKTPEDRLEFDDELETRKRAPVVVEDKEPEPTWAWEGTMGFAGSVLDPSTMPFVFQEGAASTVPSAAGLSAPFGGPSARQLITAGPAWEVRAIQSHVRFTLGLQKPFAQFRQGALDADVDVGGTALRLSPRSLSLWVVRFGLGGEYTFGRVTPFADVVGDIQLASADVSINGEPGTFRSSGFGFSARAGARLRIDRYLSVGLAAEYGLVGAPRYGATLLVGWVLPID